jgi:hypothetical protein
LFHIVIFIADFYALFAGFGGMSFMSITGIFIFALIAFHPIDTGSIYSRCPVPFIGVKDFDMILVIFIKIIPSIHLLRIMAIIIRTTQP